MLKHLKCEQRARCMTMDNTTATEGRRHLNSKRNDGQEMPCAIRKLIVHVCNRHVKTITTSLGMMMQTSSKRSCMVSTHTHTLSKTSLFEYPTWSHCNAYVWKDERNRFCCMSGKVDLTYNTTNPKPGSIPPQPPNAIKDLFINQNFVKDAKQYNNSLAMANFGIREVAIPGFNPSVLIQGKVYHYIASPLPEQGQVPHFAQIYFHDPAHEVEFRRTHASNSGLNEEFLLRVQEAIQGCNPYVQQFKPAIEYVTQNDTANELRIVLTTHTRRCDLHRSTVNLPSLDSDVAVIAPGTTPTEQFGKLAVTLHLRGGRLCDGPLLFYGLLCVSLLSCLQVSQWAWLEIRSTWLLTVSLSFDMAS